MADERKGLLLVVMVLLVGLTAGQLIQDGQGGIPEIVAEEDTKVTLPCGSGRVESQFVMRQWVRGFMNTSTMGEETLFTQTPDTTIQNTSRDDLSLEKTSFNLTIGETRLEDTSIFTCFIEATGRAYYIYIHLTVYVTSKLVIGPDHINASDQRIFSPYCSIYRVYPALPNVTIIMYFKGERNTPSVGVSKKSDGTYEYHAHHIALPAKKSYNGEEITCHVRPRYGKPLRASKVLIVYYAPEGKPAIHTDHRQGYIGDELLLQCAHGTVVNGNPRFYTYRWFLDDQLLRAETRDLTFTASSESAGNYSCDFKNSLGFTSRSDDLVLQVLGERGSPVAGIVVGTILGLVLLLLVVAAVIWYRRRPIQTEESQDNKTSNNDYVGLRRFSTLLPKRIGSKSGARLKEELPVENDPLNTLSKDGRRKLEKEAIKSQESLGRLKDDDISKLNLKIGDKNKLQNIIIQCSDPSGTYLEPTRPISITNQPLEDGALWNSLSKDGRTKLKDEEINMNEDLRRLKLEDVEKMNLRLGDKNLVLHHLGQMNGNEASIYDEVTA